MTPFVIFTETGWELIDTLGTPSGAVLPLSIASTLAIGSPAITRNLLVSPSGRASTLTVGSPLVNSASVRGWLRDTSNVGLAGVGLVGADLPLYTGSTTPVAGTTITEKRIVGTLDLSAGNITVERCLIRPTSIGLGLPMITTSDESQNPPALAVIIRDCDIDATAAGSEDRGRSTGFWGIANLYRNEIWGMGSGIAILQSGSTLNCVVEGNYVHSLHSFGDPATTGNHCDGFTIRGFQSSGRTCLVKDNKFDCTTANASGALFLQTYETDIRNVTVQGNHLIGEGYNLVLETQGGNTYSGMVATDNRFTPTGYGVGYVSGGPGWTDSQNYLYNASNPPTYQGTSVNL